MGRGFPDTGDGHPMTPRLVTRFADDMARELENTGHKSGWQDLSPRQCLARAEHELAELRRAMERGDSFESIRSEAAEVGTFLAMLVWNECSRRRRAAHPEPGDGQ